MSHQGYEILNVDSKKRNLVDANLIISSISQILMILFFIIMTVYIIKFYYKLYPMIDDLENDINFIKDKFDIYGKNITINFDIIRHDVDRFLELLHEIFKTNKWRH